MNYLEIFFSSSAVGWNRWFLTHVSCDLHFVWLQVWAGACATAAEEPGWAALPGSSRPAPELVWGVLAVGWGWQSQQKRVRSCSVCLCLEISLVDRFLLGLGTASPLSCLNLEPERLAEGGPGLETLGNRDWSLVLGHFSRNCRLSLLYYVGTLQGLLLGVTNAFGPMGDAVNCVADPPPLWPVGFILVALLSLVRDLNVGSQRTWYVDQKLEKNNFIFSNLKQF